MVGVDHVVEGAVVDALGDVVECSVVAVGAHYDAVIPGGTGLGDQERTDRVVVVNGVYQLDVGVDHGGELVGEVLRVHRSGALLLNDLDAALLAGQGEGVDQTLRVGVRRAGDGAHAGDALLIHIRRGDAALERILEAARKT